MNKSYKVVNDLKTTSLVMGLSLTLSSCDFNKSGSDDHNYTEISHKTDSVLQKNLEYNLALRTQDSLRKRITQLQEANKTIVRNCAKKYLRRHITDNDLYVFMLKKLQNEYVSLNSDNYDDVYEYGDVDLGTQYMSTIRRNHRWFNNVMLYLSGKYDDAQFLKTDFFEKIKDEKSLIAFENNLKEIQRYQKLDRAKNEHIISLHDNTYNKGATEYKKSKQR